MLGQSINTVSRRSNGSLRVWLQGSNLCKANFKPGKRFRVEATAEGDAIELVLTATGRKVSRKIIHGTEVPIIDLNNNMVRDFVGDSEKVCVTYEGGKIIVRLHSTKVSAKARLDKLRNVITGQRPLRIGSVCHGGGVLDAALSGGLEKQGIQSEHAFVVDIEKKYLEASAANSGCINNQTLVFEMGIEDVDLSTLPDVDLLVAGLPCTGASISGKSKNKISAAEEHESAGTAFLSFLNVIKAVNCSYVVLENVLPYRTSLSMTMIRAVLKEWGYTVHETEVYGPDFGAFERRRRMVMIATTEGVELDVADLQQFYQPQEVTLKDFVETEGKRANDWRTFDYLKRKEVADKKAGKGFTRQEVTLGSTGCGVIGRHYQKSRSTEPFVQHPERPELLRLFTPTEHAFVKTVPPHIIQNVATTTAHEILGQGVIYNAFTAVGQLLAKSVGCALIRSV